MKITYKVYKPAPEQSVFYVDGKVFSPMYTQLSHDLGMLVVEGKKKEAEDKIKRIVRAQRLKKRRCTIGFYEQGTNRFFYTFQLLADDTNLQEKLRVYKEWKRYCESVGCIMKTHEVTSGKFIPGEKSNSEVKIIKEIADLTRPVKVYVAAA